MAKLGLDKDVLKRFFSLHIEKIVLGVVVLLLVLFVYRGYSLEGLANDKRPDQLKQKANQLQQYISNPEVAPEIVAMHKPATGFVDQTKAGQAPISSVVFAAPLTPSPPKPSGLQREDPEIFAPVEVEAVALTEVGIPYIPVSGEVDPFQNDENMAPKEPEEEPNRRRRGRDKDRDDPYGGYGGMGGYGGEGESEDGGMGGLAGIPGMADEGGEGMAGMPGMPGMPGMGVGAGGVVMADPSVIEGFRPPTGSIVIAKHVVGITALVPYKKQWDAFEATLSNAMGYTKTRDVPNYLGFYAERAEVEDESDTDLKWVAISNSDFVVKRMVARQRPYGGWAGFPQEIADPRYVMPNVLTMPIPPVVWKPYEDIALHSKIPKYQIAIQSTETDDSKPETPEESGGPDEIGSAPSLTRTPGGIGYGGEGGAGGAGMPGMGGYGAGAPGMPGMGGMGGAPGMPGESEMSGYGAGATGMAGGMPGMPGGMDMGGYGAEGGEGGYGAGDMAGMGAMGGMTTFGPTVDYLMVRFFDLSVRDTTKKYRYRIQLWIEDPNHPKNPLADPNVRALAPDVRTRITDIKAKEAKAKSRLSYFRVTEFSEPSPVVSFEQSGETLGGEIAEVRETSINDPFGNQFELPTSERSAEVMAVVWDTKRAVEVPGVVEAYRGTFLNFVQDADVVHPVSLQYKTIKDYGFKTNRMVLDFQGGEPLPVPEDEEEDNPLRAPTEFLILNENGELFVKNELDDWDGFQKHLPPKPVAAADSMMGGPGMGDAGMGEAPGMGYGEGMYGGEGDDAGAGAGGRGRGRGRGRRGGT